MRRARSTRLAPLALLAFLLLPPLGPVSAQPLFSPTQDPLAGSRAFGVKGCGSCHAVGGVGGTVAPDLGRIPRPRSFYDLAAAMWNHLPQMAERMRQRAVPRPHLNAREAGDLIAFLFTVNYFDPPGDPAAGRRLFAGKQCVVCHQVGGIGGVVGPNLDFIGQYGSPILVAAAMWNHGPAMTEAMRSRRIERPTFRESELLDLIAYLKSASPAPVEGPLYVLPGRAAEGRRLFAEKRCLACHSMAGQGGRVGPDLAERAVHRSLTQFAAAMWNKAPAMLQAMKTRGIPVPHLTAAEMADLVAYLYSVRYFGEPGDGRRGQELAAAKGCLTCHTVSGRGGKVAGDLARVKGLDSAPAVIAALWNHAFLMEQWPERQKVAWPRFRAEEMADLVAFLRGTGRAR